MAAGFAQREMADYNCVGDRGKKGQQRLNSSPGREVGMEGKILCSIRQTDM